MTEKELFDWVKEAALYFHKEKLPDGTSIMLIANAGAEDISGMRLGKWKNQQEALVKLMVGSRELLKMFDEAVSMAKLGVKAGHEEKVKLEVVKLVKKQKN